MDGAMSNKTQIAILFRKIRPNTEDKAFDTWLADAPDFVRIQEWRLTETKLAIDVSEIARWQAYRDQQKQLGWIIGWTLIKPSYDEDIEGTKIWDAAHE